MIKYLLRLIPYKIKEKLFPKIIRPDEYKQMLMNKGITIGKGTFFFSPSTTTIDTQRPWMLEIGEYCKITQGTIILCHDYSRSVLRKKYQEIICEAKKTIIGNNVFVGVNTVILMGSKIGNNVIIGANSVVSGNVPDDVVIAGNPAKIIRTLDNHLAIRKTKFVKEAKLYAKEFFKKYSKFPKENEMTAFFPIFLEKKRNKLIENNIWTNWNGDDEEEIIQSFLKSETQYLSFKHFLNEVKLELEEEDNQ